MMAQPGGGLNLQDNADYLQTLKDQGWLSPQEI